MDHDNNRRIGSLHIGKEQKKNITRGKKGCKVQKMIYRRKGKHYVSVLY